MVDSPTTHTDRLSQSEQNAPFFTLSPAILATALQKHMGLDDLSDESKLYARSVLLQQASDSVITMHDQTRLEGGLTAQQMPPAHSISRVGPYEESLYKLIDKGDVAGVKSVVQPQTITSTAHPNFSRSQQLVKDCNELAKELATFSLQEQHYLEKTGDIPEARSAPVKEILDRMKGLMHKPRDKRTRAQELEESVLDLVPKAMDAVDEQRRIYERRRSSIGEFAKQDGKNLENPDEAEHSTFKNVAQLKAFATTLPEFNSWFVDGDGKRTCHVYDAEMAIPAVKRATYEGYIKDLDAMPDNIGEFDTQAEAEALRKRVAVFARVEKLAEKRIDAFNDMQAKNVTLKEDTSDMTARREFNAARENAESISREYMELLDAPTDVDGMAVKDLLMADDITGLKERLTAELDASYQGTRPMDETCRDQSEGLFLKLEAYGNYAVHMQRRENAVEYKDVIQYLIENNGRLREAIAFRTDKDPDDVPDLFKDERTPATRAYTSEVIRLLAESAASANDPFRVKDTMMGTYKKLAGKLEKKLKPNGEETTIMRALERREFLALDGMGFYNMARLYPEAFKGGFVIAEYAQPDIEVLQNGSEEDIRSEVKRMAQDDLLTQVAFAHGMGADQAKIIPLNEDPATMKYVHEAQAELRQGPALQHSLQVMGINATDSPAALETAQQQAMGYIDEKGEVQKMNALQYYNRLGVTEQELQEQGLDVKALAHTKVLLSAEDDMEACSDITKRSTTIGKKRTEQSIRNKNVAAAAAPIEIGPEGNKEQFILVRGKYLGQGGAIARATKVPLDTTQATWQGEHLAGLIPKSLAFTNYNRMLGRLFMTQEAALRKEPSMTMLDRVFERPGHTGNTLGLPRIGASDHELQLIEDAIQTRIAHTRDDDRYDSFLQKYGEPSLNYSARPAGKRKGVAFNSERAIGTAAKESGIWSNVIGTAELFKFDKQGRLTNLDDIKTWVYTDPDMQHMMTSGALTVNFVNLEAKWKHGGIAYKEEDGHATLIKDGHEVPLEKLVKHYEADPNNKAYTDPETGATFDAADLVMAHLTDQFHRLEKGLHQVYPGRKTDLDLFDKPHQETITKYKKLHADILEKLHETEPDPHEPKPVPGEPKSEKQEKRELLEGAYYVLFESGEGVFPMPALIEHQLYDERQQAVAHETTPGVAV